MSTAMRRTGVNVLGDMPWGSHVCMFYESKEDLLDTVGHYFKAGLESNEFCLWAPSDPVTVEEARVGLSRRIPDFDRHLAAGDMDIVSGREWYLQGNRFDLKRIAGAWDEKLRGALAKGYDGMRISGDAFWSGTGYWKDFCDYEREVNKSFKGKRMTALCTYSIVTSGAAEVLEVARAHQFAVARRKGDWELVEPVPAAPTPRSLTLREREVLCGRRRANRPAHQNAIHKLGVVNRPQAVATALRERLIGKDPPSGKAAS